ncbi:group I truncated hemoglobin [Ectobacillus ponti]|uniref:Group 1 truncated hemoglobin n=1 Tax=Ectobacillus ponti TaxID=2961894 RepID=A0AA41X9M2_9BACI|nr:group 1 truncated hemoglobin [Ectobacillus ponti]MCP8969425.1 group 1 truncated hemoglobin [Ectobacillus ponti]
MENNVFQQIGGQEKLGMMAADLHDRIQGDASLQAFFGGLSPEQQHEHQQRLLTMATGGPHGYSSDAVAEAHRNMAQKHEHFDAIVGYLRDTMQAHGVEDHHLAQVMNHVAGYRQHIVKE